MVSESETGVTFSWEKQAQHGEEMPDNLPCCDNIIYLELRNLYAAVRNHTITRDTAIKEKKKLLEDYRQYQFQEEMRREWVAVIKATELTRAEFRKAPTVENGWNLINAIEGRNLREAEN